MKAIFRNNGLSIVLGALFVIFWGCQAVAGWHVHNEDQLESGILPLTFAGYLASGLIEENEERPQRQKPPESMSEFPGGSQFWFQSFQNWQSEFLAVLSIVTLSIFLRQHGSPESKTLDAAHTETGR